MAKTKKKPTPVKSASKKPVAAKTAAKPAAKLAAAKKPNGKPAAKPVADAKQKKAVAAKPVKAAEKPTKKAAPPVKEKAKAPVAAPKKAAAPQKPEAKKATEKELKKATPEPAAAKAAAKKEAKANPKKGPKGAKKDETQEEDDYVSDDDFGAVDEIGEYEEELKAVEELDEEAVEDETWTAESKDKGDEEVILTDAEGRRYCRSRDCDQIGIVDGYCRYHYLLFWKKIQVRKKILQDGKLERYVEELTARYPDKFLEMIRRDLRTEKDFLAAIQELEIDESAGENEFEEDTNAYIEEVRGMGEGGGSGVEEEEF
ncbi:hypothetical protein [Bdellovibrio sp. HCB337]|uniref:hypothetical protein n=1 Tax=Bdellovibrio sp. HCB337 TaxID=3394358 RepID=UPI0039A6044F